MSGKPSQPPAKLKGGFEKMKLAVREMLKGAGDLFEFEAKDGAFN